MCLSQSQYERVFGGIVRLERFTESTEDFLIFVLVLLGEDDAWMR